MRHTVRSVALRTGLTPHVIRVWERRYGTVTPSRSSGNQRLYTEADVERLALLKQVTDRGHSISRVTALPTEQLSLLVSAEDRSTMIRTEAGGSIAGLLETAFQAVADMDAAGLERVLEQGALRLGQIRLLAQVVARFRATVQPQLKLTVVPSLPVVPVPDVTVPLAAVTAYAVPEGIALSVVAVMLVAVPTARAGCEKLTALGNL